jgi:hypothetical protein
MNRLLIFGFLVAVALVGFFLISGSETQISSSAKSSSQSVTEENSIVSVSRQVPSEKSAVSSIRSSDIQAALSPTGDRSIEFQNGAKPEFTKNSASVLLATTNFSGTSFSTQGFGSTAISGSEASGVGVTGGPIREITIPVPEGAKVPALFQDDTPKPPQQMKALDRIANEFEQNVSEIPTGMTQEEVWEAARLIADERYMTLFGYQAYNQYHIKAAKEALKEKRANSKGP